LICSWLSLWVILGLYNDYNKSFWDIMVLHLSLVWLEFIGLRHSFINKLF